MNQGVHTVDLLLWFLGRPVEVTASAALLAHERIEVEDTVAAVVRFESGALAALHATTAAYPGVTVADATLALATVHAVYEAARTGQRVQVADVLEGRVVLPASGWRGAVAA